MTDYKSLKNKDLNFGSRSESTSHQDLEDIFGTLLNTKDNADMGDYYEFDKWLYFLFFLGTYRKTKSEEVE